MPAIPIGGVTDYNPSTSSNTVHFGSIRAGDIICVISGIFFGTAYWTVSDNLGNGTNTDNLGHPMYAKGAWQFVEGGNIGAFWAVSLIDGDLSVTVKTSDDPKGGTPIVQRQLTIVRVYRFPKVYAIDQSARGVGGFGFIPSGGGFNCAQGTGPVSYADTLVVTGVITINDLDDLTPLTGDAIRNDVDKPFGPGPFDQKNTLYALDRSNTGPGNGNVQIKYNCGQGTVGTSMVVMTFSVPLPDPPGLRVSGGRQYAARGGTGFDNNALISVGDQETSLVLPAPGLLGFVEQGDNRPIVLTFPYEVKIGDWLLIDIFVPNRNPSSIQIWDEYGTGFPDINYPPYANGYTQRILSSTAHYLAIYTCMVRFLPRPAFAIQEGGIFQVHLNVSAAGDGAVYQATAIGITAVTVAAEPTNIAVADHLSNTQVGTNQLMKTNVIPSVPVDTYLHAFAGYLPNQTQTSMSWSSLEGYAIQPESHWDVFQFGGAITNQPRTAGCAVMDKFAPSDDDYDAEVTAVLPAFAASGGIVLLAASLPPAPPGPPTGQPCDGPGNTPQPLTDNQFEIQRMMATMRIAKHLPVR